jgi:hypothetical protein
VAIVVGVLVAVAGWLVNEFFARRSVRRNLRVEYLLSAYRRLEHASNRQMTVDHESALEEAVSDIQLLGSRLQVEMATAFARGFAADQRADTEPLLEDLRASLRRELQLEAVPRQGVWLRITGGHGRAYGPAVGEQSWAVWSRRTVAVATSVHDALRGSAHAGDEGDDHLPGASPFVREMLALARSSPIGAVTASQNRVGQEIVRMLEADGGGDVTGLNVAELAQLARERSLISRSTRDGIDGISVMHTMALLEGGHRLRESQARDYIALAEGLLLAMRLPARPDSSC